MLVPLIRLYVDAGAGVDPKRSHMPKQENYINGPMDEKMIWLLGSPGDFWTHDIQGCSFKRFTIKRVTLFPEHLSWWECCRSFDSRYGVNLAGI